MALRKLPLVLFKIKPNDGSLVHSIALTGNPAIESDFIAFAADDSEKPDKAIIIFSDDEARELIGAAMIPDQPIYRKSDKHGEYMGVFKADTIREIAQVFAERGFFNNMNIEHTDRPAGSFVFQSYIVDSAKGINAPAGIDVPDGSWIVGVKVKDDAVWQDIKAGKTTGFSVEGVFELIDTDIEINMSKEEEDELPEEVKNFISAMEDLANIS